MSKGVAVEMIVYIILALLFLNYGQCYLALGVIFFMATRLLTLKTIDNEKTN